MKRIRGLIIALLVSVSAVSASFCFTACGQRSLTGITVSGEFRTEYIEGQTFDADGIIVTAVYEDGTTAEISGYKLSKTDALETTDEQITLSYTENGITRTAEIKITVKENTVTGITLDTDDVRTQFYVGGTFGYTGLEVFAVYDDGSHGSVDDFTVTAPDLSRAGTAEVVVVYQDHSASYNVIVSDVKAESITIGGRYQTAYYESETFNTSGMTVTIDYNNGDSVTLEEGDYTVTPEVLSADTHFVKIVYTQGGVTLEHPIEVFVTPRVMTGITITSLPKTDYREGETFDSEGIVISAVYNNIKYEPLQGYTLSIEDGAAFEGTGNRTVTVTYDEFTTSFTVNVHRYTGIVVKGDYKKVYVCGEVFDPRGIEVYKRYDGGDAYDLLVESGYTVSDNVLTVADNTVTVSYGNYSAAVALNVSHSFTEHITKQPTYFEDGEADYRCVCGEKYSAPVSKLRFDSIVTDNYVPEQEPAYSREFLIDSEGTVVSGGGMPAESDNPPVGGIGYLDKEGSYVEYRFYTYETGTFDMVWRVAGNKWSNNVNLGIDDLSDHLLWTIDGMEVNVDGIALPAGDSAQGESVWWNMKDVAAGGIELAAGYHVVRFYNISNESTTGNAFPNVGSFKLYSTVEASAIPTASVYDHNGYTADASQSYSLVMNSDDVKDDENPDGAIVLGGDISENENGVDKSFGSFEDEGKYIEYTFTLTEDGSVTVDFSAAGSKWNGSGNDGLDNVSSYVKFTIDGLEYNFGDIALPAGTDGNEWINFYEIVFENLVLTAGAHTLRLEIISSGGLNIEDLTLYSAVPITAGA